MGTNTIYTPSRFFLRVLHLLTTSFFIIQFTFSQNLFTGLTGASWGVTTNWLLGVPTASQDVSIPAGISVVINTAAVCKSLTIESPLLVNSSLTIAGTNSLTVTNEITINPPVLTATSVTLAVGAGTLTCSSLTMVSPGSGRLSAITLSSGTININGNLTAGMANRTSITITGSGTINLAGTITQGSLSSSAISTFNYNGGVAQTVATTNYNYGNLHFNNIHASGASLAADLTATIVQGHMEVQSGILNNGGFSVSLAAGKNFEVAAGATFNLSGTSSMPALSGSGNYSISPAATVHYLGGVQSIAALSYGNLSCSGTGTKTLLGNTTVSGQLSLGTILDLTNYLFTLGIASPAIATIGGTAGFFSNSKMIIASGGGELRKSANSAATASYFFPIGDNTGTVEYSPVTLTFSGGTYAGFASVKVTDAMHPANGNQTSYITRYWTVTQNGFTGFSAAVNFAYVHPDVQGNEINIRLGKWDAAEPWTRFPSSINTGSNFLFATVTSFSEFTGINSQEALPVKLSDFRVYMIDHQAVVTWATSEEISSAYYEVGHSIDGQRFTTLTKVSSNNMLSGSSYSYKHLRPFTGKNYYRLKMVDMDAGFEYSPIIMLTSAEIKKKLSAYPNPATSDVTIQFEKAFEGASLNLVDMQGKIIRAIVVRAGVTLVQVNLNGIARGMYQIVYKNGGEKTIYHIQKN